MENNSANSFEQEASENLNIDDRTTNNPNPNLDPINSNSANYTTSNNIQLPEFNDSSPQTQIQQIKSFDFQTKSVNPTVLVELSEDDNDKNSHDQFISQKEIRPDQNAIDFSNKIDNQAAMNRFLLSNINQGQNFANNDLPSLTSNPEIQPNADIETDSNKDDDTLIPHIIPELRRSGQSDINLLESKTPSNITTEENSPKSRPFSPDTLNSPGSPPHVENTDQDIKNDEPQFKTLTIIGDDEDNDNNKQEENYNSGDEIYKDNHEHETNQNESRSQITNFSIQTIPNQPIILRTNTNTNQSEYSGLQNQGATCYMNSMLQALYHLPIFRRFIYEMDYSEAASDEQNIPLNLQRLFAMMQLRIRSSIPTKELTNSFGWTDNQTYTQHDVQEFCRVILDNIESKMKKQENLKDAIGYLFRGKVKSEIRLKTNEVENSTTEEFYDLSMVVKDTNSLEESFQKYIEPEIIPDYDTETGKQEITKTVEFIQFPPVLYIHLRRFEYDPETQNMKKINSRFEFPETIDLSQFLSDDADQNECQIFDLFGVLVHNGGSYSGHYFAYLKPTGDEDRWFLFNDSCVSEVRKEEAIDSNFGGTSEQTSIFERSYSAYMLIYIRRSCIPEFYEKVSDSEIPESAAKYAQEKKEKYERQMEEKKRIENTISFKMFGDDDLRKNALNCSISFNFHRNKLLNVDVMRYEVAENLYEKVAKLIKLRKFTLYEVDSIGSFIEISRDSDSLLQSMYCKYIYIYTNYKENRIINRQKYQNHRHIHRRYQNHQPDEENQNENEINDDENGENENSEITISNNENNVDNVNDEVHETNNENERIDQIENIENDDTSINNNDNNEGLNVNDGINENGGNFNEEFNNISINEEENNNEYEYEKEEEEEEDKNEEEEEEDNTEAVSDDSNYGLFPDEDTTSFAFFFIFLQNRKKHPIRFWKADRIKTKWRASKIYNKCEKIFRVYPNSIYYKMYSNDKYVSVEPDSKLNFAKNGTIIVIEIDNSYLPPMIRFNDNRILQMDEDEEEEEEEEEGISNYLDKYPLQSFQEYLSYYTRQITFKIFYERNYKICRVPYKVSNDRFIIFVRNLFKISKNLSVVFYGEKSKTPYEIFPNHNSLDKALNDHNDTVLYAYAVSQMMSFSLFRDNYRIMYYIGDGYFQNRLRKFSFVSNESRVRDLIEYKISTSTRKVENRLITIYDNKITIEDPDEFISDLRGRIRIEEIPEEEGDSYIQLMISKDVASYLEIFSKPKGKYNRKSKYTKSIECLFPIYDNEMFPDTVNRIVDTFKCNESKMCNISFQLIDPNSYNKYARTLGDIDTISELIQYNDQYYYILSLDIIQRNDGAPLPITMQSRNQDSICIQN